jgi:type IV pilus assembly protein PilE
MAMPRRTRRFALPAHRQAGFTLIELMIAVAIVGILAAIAYPQYTEFVQRSRIADATSSLNDFRTRMEQYFQDNRTYLNGANCGVPDPALVGSASFQLVCNGASATGYTLNATGLAAKGMGSFQYRLTVAAAGVTRATILAPGGWVTPANCWAIRKGGDCS